MGVVATTKGVKEISFSAAAGHPVDKSQEGKKEKYNDDGDASFQKDEI